VRGHLHAHAIGHYARERQLGLAQPLVEEGRLVERVLAGRRDHHERAALVREQGVDLAGPLAEALHHPAEAAEELRQVGEQVHAGGALHRPEQHAAAAAEQLEPQDPRAGEQLERGRVDERRQLARRVEEVECVPGRRRVEHQQVVEALAVQLVELLHRHVLLRAGHGVRQLAVDRVGEHGVARALVGRVLVHQLVEGALGVEHHRPQLALHRRIHQVGLVSQLVQAQRVREAARGVDREDGDLAATGGHAERDGRGGGCLAHAAGPGAHAHLLSL
jgi:hypothetical protein